MLTKFAPFCENHVSMPHEFGTRHRRLVPTPGDAAAGSLGMIRITGCS